MQISLIDVPASPELPGREVRKPKAWKPSLSSNLLHLYGFVGMLSEAERTEYGNYYFHYNRILRGVAEYAGYPLDTVCAVFSALSPNNDYIGNLRDCITVLRSHAAGKTVDEFKVSTYGNNKRKAWALVGGGDADTLIVALKTRAFYENLKDPETSQAVTVDGHMYWAWHGRRGLVTSRNKEENKEHAARMTPSIYHRIADDVRTVAAKHGYMPHAVQAMVWQSYRQSFNIMRSSQPELLPKDLEMVHALMRS